MWNNYPKNLMENVEPIHKTWIEPKPLKEVKDRIARSDYYTRFMRKKFPLDQSFRG